MSSPSVCYAVVVSNEDDEAANRPVGVAVDANVRTTSFKHIQEANDCTWHDEFYDNRPDIIAAFDTDTELVQTFYTKKWFAFVLPILAVQLMNKNHNYGNYVAWIVYGFYLCTELVPRLYTKNLIGLLPSVLYTLLIDPHNYGAGVAWIVCGFYLETEVVLMFCNAKKGLPFLLSIFAIQFVRLVHLYIEKHNYGNYVAWIANCFYLFLLYRLFAEWQQALKQVLIEMHVAISTEGVKIESGECIFRWMRFDKIATIKAFPQKLFWCLDAGFQTVIIEPRLREEEKVTLKGIKNADAFVRLLNALKADGGRAVLAETATVPAASVEMIEDGIHKRKK